VVALPKKDKIDPWCLAMVAKRNYYPLATVDNKKKCLPLTQMILNTRKHSSIACNISPIPLSPFNIRMILLFYAVWWRCQKRIK
jgi:hypothetical protein